MKAFNFTGWLTRSDKTEKLILQKVQKLLRLCSNFNVHEMFNIE
jgi:hypothetical protein